MLALRFAKEVMSFVFRIADAAAWSECTRIFVGVA